MSDAKNQAGLMTVAQAAAMFQCTERWIRELCNKGYIPKPQRGMVPLVGAVRGYIASLKDEERKHSRTAEARRVQAARAHEIELRTAREEGRLIYLESAEQVFADTLGVYRSRLAGVPAAASRDLTIRQAIEDQLERAIGECREDFKRKKEELVREARKGRRE